jgi:membrane-associated phospholipid phosphatase
VFALAPAAGPSAAYGYAPNATQARYLAHLHELREGARTIVTWRGAEGLITFPSFHTTWAMLLAWGVRKHNWALALSIPLNLAVIAATTTTGWHYFADVVGGVIVGAAVITMTELRQPPEVCAAHRADTIGNAPS